MMAAGGARLDHIGVVGHEGYEGLDASLETVRAFSERHGIELSTEEALRSYLPEAGELRPEAVDLLITLGGDGTLLRGARSVAPYHTPVLGVNLGYLGFLTAVPPTQLAQALDQLLAGDYWLDRRFTLEASVLRDGDSAGPSYVALNDAVLHKGGFARVVRLAVYVGEDRWEVGTYSADGVIISTPTGSTAYSLSAGGPIVVPSVDCILATPICPHTLAVRPLVVPSSMEISVEVLTPSEEIILTIDGQEGAKLLPGDRVVVRRGAAEVPLVRLPGQNFFSTLRRKLHWGIGRSDPSKH